MKPGATVNTEEFTASMSTAVADLRDSAYRAVVAAGLEVRNDAIRRSPVDTGLLRAGWRMREGTSGKVGWVEVYNSTPYAPAVEYGTRPHTIRVRNKKVLANRGAGQVFGKVVNHPGTPPRPMLRPAIDRVAPVLRAKLGG